MAFWASSASKPGSGSYSSGSVVVVDGGGGGGGDGVIAWLSPRCSASLNCLLKLMRDDDDDDDGDDDGDVGDDDGDDGDDDDDDDGADDGGVDVGGGGCGGSGVVVELNFEGVEAGSSSSSSSGSEGDPDDDLKYSANAGQSISTIRLFFVQQISIFEIKFFKSVWSAAR